MHSSELINTLAIPLGALCVGVVSAIIVLLAPTPKTPRVRFWAVFGIPFVLAIALNFLPIWDRGSYPSCGWEVIAILMWTTPGAVASTLIVNYKERRSRPSGKVDT